MSDKSGDNGDKREFSKSKRKRHTTQNSKSRKKDSDTVSTTGWTPEDGAGYIPKKSKKNKSEESDK